MINKIILTFEQFIAYYFYRRQIEVYIHGNTELWTQTTIKKLPNGVRFTIEGKEFIKENIYFCQL